MRALLCYNVRYYIVIASAARTRARARGSPPLIPRKWPSAIRDYSRAKSHGKETFRRRIHFFFFGRADRIAIPGRFLNRESILPIKRGRPRRTDAARQDGGQWKTFSPAIFERKIGIAPAEPATLNYDVYIPTEAVHTRSATPCRARAFSFISFFFCCKPGPSFSADTLRHC